MTLLHGWNGPYNNFNSVNRGANTGYKVAQMAKYNSNALSQTDIQYTTRENGKFSIDGGLAYAMESLTGADQNNDGTVTTQETGFLGQVIDLNNDGIVSAAENLAYTMYQDASGTMDGIATAEEREQANEALMNDPARARQQMMRLFQGHNLEQREANLTQNLSNQYDPYSQYNQQTSFQELFPPPPPPPPQMMQFMQSMMQMFMQMFSSMFQGQNNYYSQL